MTSQAIRRRPTREIAHLRIHRLRSDNPRRSGTHGWHSWKSYRDGMTVAEYLAQGPDAGGGRRRHLDWDIEHGFVALMDHPRDAPGEMVIVAYRPKPDRDDELLALTREHLPLLRRLGLATDRPALAMRAGDGTIVETFEWRAGGAAAAHTHPEVLVLWRRYAACCDYVPLRDLPEARELFARFAPLPP